MESKKVLNNDYEIEIEILTTDILTDEEDSYSFENVIKFYYLIIIILLK